MGKAIDETRVNLQTVTIKMAPSWDPEVISTNKTTCLITSNLTKKPDTIHNQKNEWGFRNMSPWSRRWLQIASPPYRYSTRVKPGMSGWFVVDGSYTCCATPYYLPSDGPSQLNNLLRLKPGGAVEVGCDNAARTRVLSRVSQKKWDLGVFALELRETTELASSLTRDVAKAWRKAGEGLDLASLPNSSRRLDQLAEKPGNLARKQTDILERFADRWMEYTFGIKPTLYDVSDACDALNVRIGEPLIAFAKAGATREDRVRWIQGMVLHKNHHDILSSISIHYCLLYESATNGVSPLTTLGLDNPYSVAWEKLPYSWMVDYILGIGDWLNTWTATSGLRLKQGCKSTVWRGHTEYVTSVPDGAWVTFKQRPKPLLNYVGGEFRRELLSSFPTPAIAPNLKQTVGGFQLANSLFALRNLVHPGFKR